MFDDEHISRLENVLEASVIADVNLVPAIIKQLVVMLKKSISKLDWMVPQDLYLPAPPLYCPQPARNDGVRSLLNSCPCRSIIDSAPQNKEYSTKIMR